MSVDFNKKDMFDTTHCASLTFCGFHRASICPGRMERAMVMPRKMRGDAVVVVVVVVLQKCGRTRLTMKRKVQVIQVESGYPNIKHHEMSPNIMTCHGKYDEVSPNVIKYL